MLIEIKDIYKIYNEGKESEVRALDGVSLQIDRGEFVAIVGQSGSGKSTMMNVLGCLDIPTYGTYLLNGTEVTELSDRQLAHIRNKEIGFIFQGYNLIQELDALENVTLPLIYQGLPIWDREDRAMEALERVGMADRAHHRPSEMSGGQQQRVGIARALAVKPEFIVCDEPISALDVSIQSQVVNMLEDMQQDLGLTYLFIAHDLSVVRHISNRIGVMYLGCLVELAESYELNRHPLHPYTKTLLSAVPVPDPEVSRSRQRIVLEGDIPSPMNPPTGCRFHTRCPYATDKCKQAVPEFKEHAPGHWAACHLLG